MRRCSSGSFSSLTSLTSINSRTKIYNNRDFQKYIANMEEDIIKISNDYYSFNERYDKKFNNIVNRYEERTNKLFIDLRRREGEYRKLSNKLEDVIIDLQGYRGLKELKFIKELFNRCEIICHYDDMRDLNDTYRYIKSILFIYTFFVIVITVNFISPL